MAAPRSSVWEHYTIYMETHEKHGVMESQRWAKCRRCHFRACAEPKRGTMQFRNHLKHAHHYNFELHQFQGPQVGEGGNANADVGEVVNVNGP